MTPAHGPQRTAPLYRRESSQQMIARLADHGEGESSHFPCETIDHLLEDPDALARRPTLPVTSKDADGCCRAERRQER
jgi:hypothetical protein